MKPRAVLARSATPALLVLALTLTAITVLSPGPGDPAGDGNQPVAHTALPPAPAAARTELVPVRAAPAEPSTRPGSRVALRLLVLATDAGDVGLPVWRQVLDRVGTPYDVVLAADGTLRRDDLVRPDGVGKYSGILLTSNAMLAPDADGDYRPTVSAGEWRTLWEYERTFDVRQAALGSSPGPDPEDYCLRDRTEVSVEQPPLPARLTGEGAKVFDYLAPDAEIPVEFSYVYRTRLARDCAATPLLTAGEDVLGVLSTAPDGRERAALTFTLNTEQLGTDLLGFGLLRWVTRGVFLGERRHWLNVDVDDWFNRTLEQHVDGTSGAYRLTGEDAASTARQQRAFRDRYPLAGDFKLNLPYNAGLTDLDAPSTCEPEDSPDPLTSYSRCLAGEFRWINHTLNHPQMNSTSYAENHREIQDNLSVAAALDLPVPAEVLKTPEYSGLGVYNPDPKAGDNAPVTDFGLEGSNTELLKAARDLGVKYLHGNMSFESHQPDCFNCGIYHPLRPEILVVPDWPTNVAFEATTAEQQTAAFNRRYGKNGSTPEHDRDLGYEEILAEEARIAAGYLMSGSAGAFTLHQGNLREYAPDRSLTFDWLNAVLAAYSAYFDVPLKNPGWGSLARYVEARNAHFAALPDIGAVWDRDTGAVTVSPAAAGSLFLTGLATRPATEADQEGPDQAENYGSDSVSRLGITEGETLSVIARPRT